MNSYKPSNPPQPRARKEIHPVAQNLIAELGPATGKKALDAPLGPGAMAFHLYTLGYNVTGADIDLRQSAGLPGEINRCQCNLNAVLPLPGARFDLVTCLEGIEHVENHFLLLRELSRVLKPGGHLIISTPNICSLEERLKFVLNGTFYHYITRNDIEQFGSGFDHQNLINYLELRQILDWNGFQVQRVLRDAVKWKQNVLLFPIWLLLKLYLAIQSQKRQAKYLLVETGSRPVLLGGNTLIVLAQKM
jgi:2-polyprenyl-3-methyl-5-hydroxy-6-metoxy-1,4-benzoquinol methylase